MTPIFKYTICEFCGNYDDCVMIKRYWQPKEFMQKHGSVFVCDVCISVLKNMHELYNNSIGDEKYMFVKDGLSPRK